MAEFKYQEPERLALGQKIYEQYKAEKKKAKSSGSQQHDAGKENGNTGNAVSILSDAMTVLRQLGPAGLDVWIDLDAKKRRFLRHAWEENAPELAASLKARQQDADIVWAEIENLMQVLRCAKYYAKTQEKDD